MASKTEKLKAPGAFNPETAEIVKNLSLPAFKLQEGEERYFRLDSAMRVSTRKDSQEDEEETTKGKGKDKEKQTRQPATVVDAIDLVSGEVGVLICTAVIKSSLTENYPNDSYVGKGFKITRKEKAPGKQYSRYNVQEVKI